MQQRGTGFCTYFCPQSWVAGQPITELPAPQEAALGWQSPCAQDAAAAAQELEQ